ncbi:Mocs2B [Symbiodinium natans]|uniref:Mocs2B protein n=1 Tax=Symbiodinium natans TaxID=878477 RepID=A0A812RPA3_9DINO|nr:Mocs2B [Symbiodinium natans]
MAAIDSADGPLCVFISHDPLSLDLLMKKVSDNGCGAITTFSGTTRDNFEGKEVVRLEYEAYEPMALKVHLGMQGGTA